MIITLPIKGEKVNFEVGFQYGQRANGDEFIEIAGHLESEFGRKSMRMYSDLDQYEGYLKVEMIELIPAAIKGFYLNYETLKQPDSELLGLRKNLEFQTNGSIVDQSVEVVDTEGNLVASISEDDIILKNGYRVAEEGEVITINKGEEK